MFDDFTRADDAAREAAGINLAAQETKNALVRMFVRLKLDWADETRRDGTGFVQYCFVVDGVTTWSYLNILSDGRIYGTLPKGAVTW